MTDLQIAKKNLAEHSIYLCKDGACLFSDKKGISPMMDLIAEGAALTGYSAADLIVGKASALLFIKCGIKSVFAKTLSQNGKRVLEKFAVPFEYEVLTDRIINRAGTDICPMEKAVLNIDDPNEAYLALQKQLQSMKQ